MTWNADDYIRELGSNAKTASRELAVATTEQKNTALRASAEALRGAMDDILDANKLDVAKATEAGRDEAFIDRLLLTRKRIEAMAQALEQIADLPDPVGRSLWQEERPNGLKINRVAVPIGVIGMVFESRPNVGSDASALCLKSGNAIILRGGSDSLASSRQIAACMAAGLRRAKLPETAIQFVDTEDRQAVRALLHCTEYVDLVIPRGGKGLVSLVREEARVPTLLHLDGNNHTYVHRDADIQKAASIVANAKMRRTGICGATETVVVDRSIAPELLPTMLNALGACEVRGEAEAHAIDSRIQPAQASDWSTEFLAPVLALKTVEDDAEALAFINAHSSAHTDAIVTENSDVAERFLNAIDSAVVMHNASTQFSDGGEFGMGAEIGIATGKLHARGPVGLEQLTTFKYQVRGTGQARS